jgi:sec-independent protein translocase protein TatA
MGFGGYGHWLIVLLIVVVLFGKGRISEMMGDFGKGIKSFKQGLNEGEEVKPQAPASQISPPPAANSATLNGETVIDAADPKQP